MTFIHLPCIFSCDVTNQPCGLQSLATKVGLCLASRAARAVWRVLLVIRLINGRTGKTTGGVSTTSSRTWLISIENENGMIYYNSLLYVGGSDWLFNGPGYPNFGNSFDGISHELRALLAMTLFFRGP